MTRPATARAPLSVLLALSAVSLTAALGVGIASVLLPTLTRAFEIPVSQAQWVVLAYLMAVTVTIVTAGRLGDLFGPRRVMIFGLVVFVLASVLCAMATGFGMLVFGRAVQGIGGAMLIALSMAVARDTVPAGQLGTAMGLLGTTSALGTALGPSLGGIVLAQSGWRGAFWLLAGFACMGLVMTVLAIRRDGLHRRPRVGLLDLPGTVALIAVVGIYALVTGGGLSSTVLPLAVLLPALLLAGAIFVRIEIHAPRPLVPMAVLADRMTGAGFAMNILVGTVMMATLVVGPFYLTFALGLSEAAVGLVLAVGPAVAAVSGLPAGRLTDRFGVRRVMLAGLIQTVAGLICLAVLPRLFGVVGYVAALVMLTPAFQLFLAANNTAVMAGAAARERGRLSGLLGLSRNLGLMTGASAMSGLFGALLGRDDAAAARPETVASAFSGTFALAAGLIVIALAVAIWAQGRGRPGQSAMWLRQ